MDKDNDSLHYDACPHCGAVYSWIFDEPSYCPNCHKKI